jgi:gamma-glutamyltranspeptidase/glutathione hydrolase
VRYRSPLDRAIDAPRWLLGRTWGSTHTNLRMEARFDGALVERLLAAGHEVEVLALHPDGTLDGAHDPRADGGAAGL